MRSAPIASILMAVVVAAGPAVAREWHVAPGGSGDGGAGSPFGVIQDGLDEAQPGDEVVVAAGTYEESLQTVRDGEAGARIVLRAAPGAEVLVTAPGRPMRVDHAHVSIVGVVFDAEYGDREVLDVNDGADHLVVRGCELRRTSRNCVNMSAPEGVLFDGCLIHRCLNWDGGRADAHGITGGAVRDLTIRDTEIHTFSGDAVQVDPGRAAPGWDRITIEGCRLWLAPLAEAENGFSAGDVPGENAVDTKTDPDSPRATLVIRDTEMWGFRGGLIDNMAALNLKENVDVVVDAVTIWDSEIAFRLRGPGSRGGAHVLVTNAVVYDVDTAFRYEDDIENLRIWNATVGPDVTAPFDEASSEASVLDVRNLLVLGDALPAEAEGGSSLAVPASAFVDVSLPDLHLAPGSPAIDVGEAIAELTTDRDGQPRPQGSGYDVGAYEHCPGGCEPVEDGGPSEDGGPGEDGGTGDGGSDDGAPGEDGGSSVDGGPDVDGGGGVLDGGSPDGGGPDGGTEGCSCRAPAPAPRAPLILVVLASALSLALLGRAAR